MGNENAFLAAPAQDRPLCQCGSGSCLRTSTAGALVLVWGEGMA